MKCFVRKEKKSTKKYNKKMFVCSALALTLCGSLLLTSYLFPESLYRPIPYGEGESAVSSAIEEVLSESESEEASEPQVMQVEAAEVESEPEFSWNEEALEEKTLYVLELGTVKAEPREEAETVSELAKDSEVIVVAKTDNGYYKTKDGGFIAVAALTETAPKFEWSEEAVSKTMMVTVNCKKRLEPRANAQTDGLLVATTVVNIVAKTDKGYYKTDDNIFVSEEYLVDAEISEKQEEESADTADTAKPETPAAPPAAENSSTPSGGNTVVHDGTVKGILNAAPLNPTSTGFAHVDQKIKEVFNQIGIYNMSDTYSKVKAIYDYLIYNTSYGSASYPSAGYGDLTEGSKGYIAWGAMRCLDIHVARCNQYTAAFIAMVRMIGLDAGYIDGMTSASGGGMVGHVWAEVYIGGQTYVFDPQVEDNMTSGTIRYARFCKTYQQVAGRYSNARRLG